MLSKINGYFIDVDLGISLNGDYSSSSSFEAPPDVNPVFSVTNESGQIEYDLSRAPTNQPRVFIINGYLQANSIADYKAKRDLLDILIKQNYFTLADNKGRKANARLKPISIKWDRKTPLDGNIVVEVGFKMDEVLQPVPYKD